LAAADLEVEGRKRERRSIVAAARPSMVAPESPVEWSAGDRQSRRRSSQEEPTAFIGPEMGCGLWPSPIPRTHDIFLFNADFIFGPFFKSD
jgi:hypothetical protein